MGAYPLKFPGRPERDTTDGDLDDPAPRQGVAADGVDQQDARFALCRAVLCRREHPFENSDL